MKKKMKILVYTFRTCPFIAKLETIYGKVVVLDKIRVDLEELLQKIKKEKPDFILGIAKSTLDYSTVEKYAINQFHKNGKVVKNVKENRLEMDIKEDCPFQVRPKGTDSYCNYSMFKIKSFLLKESLDIPFSFYHLKEEDIEKLIV